MKLLICTQKVDKDDPVLGFFHRWLEEFAKHCIEVHVICLYEGEHTLPANVHVHSLGKENSISRLKYIVNFYKYIFRLRKRYDSVFVHMNPEYVVLGGTFWRGWKKKISLWYTHKNVGVYLRIAEYFTNIIFTASEESFRLPSKKVQITGHGIDVELFHGEKKKNDDTFKILTVGRISPVKDYETLLIAISQILNKGQQVALTIIGGPGTPDQAAYETKLRSLAGQSQLKERVSLAGSMPQTDIIDYLQQADLFVSMSLTGSLDKAVLEAMATQTPVLSCNEAASHILKAVSDMLTFSPRDPGDLESKIMYMMQLDPTQRAEIGSTLRKIVVEQHEVRALIGRIVKSL